MRRCLGWLLLLWMPVAFVAMQVDIFRRDWRLGLMGIGASALFVVAMVGTLWGASRLLGPRPTDKS